MTKEIKEYKKYSPLIREGVFHRLLDTKEASCCLFVSQDKSKALLIAVNKLSHGNPTDIYVKLNGLDDDKTYSVNSKAISGKLLIKAGYLVPFAFSTDYEAVRVFIEEIK